MKKIVLLVAVSLMFGLTGYSPVVTPPAEIIPPLNKPVYLPLVFQQAISVCRFGVAGLPKNAVYNTDLHIAKIGGLFFFGTTHARVLPQEGFF